MHTEVVLIHQFFFDFSKYESVGRDDLINRSEILTRGKNSTRSFSETLELSIRYLDWFI